MNKIAKILFAMAICSAGAACGSAPEGYSVVSPAEFAKGIKADPEAYVLDVRTPQEFADGHIQGAHNLDWLNQPAFREGAAKLPKVDTIYVYCRSGGRSAQASAYLTKLGYKVVDLDGGYQAWQAQARDK